jgi:hypothetical protein
MSHRRAERPPSGGPTALPERPARACNGVMTDGAHIHQCPYCELKFLYATEIKSHVVADHPEHARAYVGMTTTEREPQPHA